LRDQLVGREVSMTLAAEMCSVLAVVLGLAGRCRRHDVDARGFQDACSRAHIGQAWHIVEDKRLIGGMPRSSAGKVAFLAPEIGMLP